MCRWAFCACIQYQECDYDLKLCNSTFTIKSNDFMVNVPCRSVQDELFLKTKFLYEQVLAFPRMKTDTDHVFFLHRMGKIPCSMQPNLDSLARDRACTWVCTTEIKVSLCVIVAAASDLSVLLNGTYWHKRGVQLNPPYLPRSATGHTHIHRNKTLTLRLLKFKVLNFAAKCNESCN